MERQVQITVNGSEGRERYRGTLSSEQGEIILRYAEHGDFSGTSSELRLTTHMVELRRSGEVCTVLRFEVGKTWKAEYQTQYGMIPFRLETDLVSVDMDEEGGTVDLRYRLTAAGKESTHRLLLTAE